MRKTDKPIVAKNMLQGRGCWNCVYSYPAYSLLVGEGRLKRCPDKSRFGPYVVTCPQWEAGDRADILTRLAFSEHNLNTGRWLYYIYQRRRNNFERRFRLPIIFGIAGTIFIITILRYVTGEDFSFTSTAMPGFAMVAFQLGLVLIPSKFHKKRFIKEFYKRGYSKEQLEELPTRF